MKKNTYSNRLIISFRELNIGKTIHGFKTTYGYLFVCPKSNVSLEIHRHHKYNFKVGLYQADQILGEA